MTTLAPPKRPEIKTALPGPKGQEIIAADQFVTPSYPRPSFKLVAERAQGVWVEDVDGNIFLDCNAGVAVCSTGHCHPEVVRAIQEQAEQLIHMCGTDYYYGTCLRSRENSTRSFQSNGPLAHISPTAAPKRSKLL